ncbi:MAG: hypothetical protein ABFD96_24860, partial [Armatimonadia bacterium]
MRKGKMAVVMMVAVVALVVCAQAAMAQAEQVRMPLIGEKAPAFTAKTTQGDITFPDDYKGKWVILFS